MSYNCPILVWLQHTYSAEKSMTDYERTMVIATFLSVIVTFLLVIAAWKQLSKLSEISREEHELIRRKATIENLGDLWEDTIEKLKLIAELNTLEKIKNGKVDEYPAEYKAVPRVFERFERIALGLLNGVYDKELFCCLVGKRSLTNTLDFFMPHIDNLKRQKKDGKPYVCKFEKLVKDYNSDTRDPCDEIKEKQEI
jgi:hypothetical protein